MGYCLVGCYDVGLVAQGFTYTIPESLQLSIGQVVLVSVAGKKRRGVVLRLFPSAQVQNHVQILPIESAVDLILLDEGRAEAILWIASYYRAPLHRVLRLFVPEGILQGHFEPRWDQVFKMSEEQPLLSNREKGLRLLQEKFIAGTHLTKDDAKEYVSQAIWKKAIDMGVVKLVQQVLCPPQGWCEKVAEIPLLQEQQERVWERLAQEPNGRFLLHGVTGSGKTEIYLRLASLMATQGKQTVILVPEISLTPQLFRLITARFGSRVSLIHSHLALGERQQEWMRIAAGNVDVIVGSRSALFSPFTTLGAIIIDECHEWTYKNEQQPRYHACTVAEKIQQISHEQGKECTLLLGSATPSVEQYAKTLDGAYHLLTMKQRVYGSV